MVEMAERELLLRSLKGYLEDLAESGIDELGFAQASVAEHGHRTSGNPRARLLFVMTGAGFAGEAGGLLAKIIEAMGFAVADVFLISFDSGSSGAASPTRDSLVSSLSAVRPEVVVTLGEEAARLLLGSGEPVGNLRGSFHDIGGIPLMPTLHPDAMLETPALKREVWSDMQQVMRRLA